ncbi:hypothetical protein [Nocardioides alcanivorans]|uniref:hypothetical protein n=1 Tax=Nocardioides alcanivorans TaxID=2897352 RepID=UPI001F253C63|nr:hypothetical protein [Nocardioides alcanivorans]
MLTSVAAAAAVAVIASGGYAATQLGSDSGGNGQVATTPSTHEDLYGPLTKANVMADNDTLLPSGGSWPAGDVTPGDGQADANPCQQSSFEGLGADQVFVGTWWTEAISLSQSVAQFPNAADASRAADDVRGWLADCSMPDAEAYTSDEPVAVDTTDGVTADRITSRWTYPGEVAGEAYTDHEMNTVVLVTGNRISVVTVEAPAGTEGMTDALETMAANAAVRLVAEDGASGAPGGTDIAWPTRIPDSIDLAHGYPETNGDGSPVEVTDEAGLDDFQLCGTPAWVTAGSVDLRGARWEAEAESARVRTLALFTDDAAASQAVEQVAGAVADCPETSSDGGASSSVNEAFSSDLGDEAYAFTTRFGSDGQLSPGLEVYQFVRVGNAVLATYDYSEAGFSQDAVRKTEYDDADAIVATLRDAFGAGGEPGSVDLTGDGFGPLVLGEPAEGVDAEVVEGDLPTRGCVPVTFQVDGEKRILTSVSTELGVAVIFLGDGDRTPEGVGVGSTREEVMAAYPEAEYAAVHNVLTARPAGHDDRHWEFFLDADDVVTEADLMLDAQDCVG